MEQKETCDCGVLDRAAKEADHPIRFDERTGEYHLHHVRGLLVFYYCPICGGRLPASRRSSLFVHVDDAERSRLSVLLASISSVADVFSRFGPPDEELDVGVYTIYPERDGCPEFGQAARRLKYKNLSAVVDVVFHVHGDGGVTRTWYAKPLVKPGEPAAHANARS